MFLTSLSLSLSQSLTLPVSHSPSLSVSLSLLASRLVVTGLWVGLQQKKGLARQVIRHNLLNIILMISISLVSLASFCTCRLTLEATYFACWIMNRRPLIVLT